jgi:Uma2 family endonuclease
MSTAEQPRYHSVEEYLAQETSALTKSEYIDGWIRAMAGGSLRHNCIKVNCLIQLGNRLRGKGCRPFDSDTKLRIDRDETKRFYYPDLQVVCQSNDSLSAFQDHPVSIVEVLSPTTRRYDLDEKMTAYLSIASLEAYIVLEQHQPIATVLRRCAGGFFRQSVEGMTSEIALPFLGCVLPMREIYDGIEFTDACVQEPDPEYELSRE